MADITNVQDDLATLSTQRACELANGLYFIDAHYIEMFAEAKRLSAKHGPYDARVIKMLQRIVPEELIVQQVKEESIRAASVLSVLSSGEYLLQGRVFLSSVSRPLPNVQVAIGFTINPANLLGTDSLNEKADTQVSDLSAKLESVEVPPVIAPAPPAGGAVNPILNHFTMTATTDAAGFFAFPAGTYSIIMSAFSVIAISDNTVLGSANFASSDLVLYVNNTYYLNISVAAAQSGTTAQPEYSIVASGLPYIPAGTSA
jgi:hypothetical protein